MKNHGRKNIRISRIDFLSKIFKNEERLLIPSPKVKTYENTPEMSAPKITKKLLELIHSGKHQFILTNFANPDMVGHTGFLNKTEQAIKDIDSHLSRIIPAALKKDYTVIVTADHGNAEQMLYPDGTICTAHTTNQVPFIIVSKEKITLQKRKNAALYDIAPTVLKIIGVKKPREMTGKSLV